MSKTPPDPATGPDRAPAGAADGLHFIATPIGNARDITLRALDLLASADLLAAEDTRSLRHLMRLHGVRLGGRTLISYHEHSAPAVLERLLAALKEGKSVVYASEAGTPLVSDPGYVLAREAIAEGLPVHGVPGPSAALAALTVSGLPSDRFMFAGFLPSGRTRRRKTLRELAEIPATLILFESPRRIHETLDDLCETMGATRQIAICRELTKKFEEVLRGRADEVRQNLADRRLKGEIVLVVARAAQTEEGECRGTEEEMLRMLEERLAQMSLKDAVAEVSARLGLARRRVYQAALAIGDENDRG